MKLIYVGKDGAYIPHVPARDLDDGDIQTIAIMWDLAIAQTEGLLIKRGLYKAEETLESTAEAATDSAAKKKGK